MIPTSKSKKLRTIQQDSFTTTVGLIAAAISIILWVSEQNSAASTLGNYAVLPALLVMVGIVEAMSNKVYKYAGLTTQKQRFKISGEALGAIAIFGMLSYFVENGVAQYAGIATIPVLSSGVLINLAFYDSMAVGEEFFFRGALANVLNKFYVTLSPKFPQLGIFVAMATDALIFALYHVFVYGNSFDTLLIIFFAGFILVAVDYSTQRLSTSLLAHIIINSLVATGLSIVHP